MQVRKLHTWYGKYQDIVTYEYRGYEYDVEYPKCIDYCCTPPYIQHKSEQERIDKIIDNKKILQHKYKQFFDEDEVFELLGW